MIAESSMPDRHPSPGLSLNLSSNNPFRNRAGSPAVPSPGLRTPSSDNSRPVSRNPFLTTFESEFNKEASKPNLVDMSVTMKDSPKKATFGSTAEELFNNLTLDDSSQKEKKAPPPESRPPPPQRSGTMPTPAHRPSRSGDDDRRRRGPPRPRGPPGPHRSSPERRENRRPRRNSESSMIDKGSLDPEEERRRRERRKDRDARSKDGKSKSGRVRKPHGLDLIDKLDVTGIYGPGLFHHDGPFDACNPHRNRKKDHRAPMQAFPVGSANNALGGAGPVNKNIDLEAFHGRGVEGYNDFSTSAEVDPYKQKRFEGENRSVSFNPKDRGDIIHGDETYGLGTSTFLEGAPASRAAIQRRESENNAATLQGDGLGRKKSIAQRIRGISQPRRFGEGNPRITSPEARYGPGTRSPTSPQQNALSGGGIGKANERNPFFDDYDDAYEKKGAAIKVAESDVKDGPSSPVRGNGLVRTATTDSIERGTEAAKTNAGGGFLNRVKSLKGGKRTRPERPAAA